MLFQTTKNILFELGATRKLGEIFAKESCRRVMLVTDKGIQKAGLLDEGLQSLKEARANIKSV